MSILDNYLALRERVHKQIREALWAKTEEFEWLKQPPRISKDEKVPENPTK